MTSRGEATKRILGIRAAGGVVVLDGGIGTELEARGAVMDDAAWCGLVNLREGVSVVRGVHEDHIRAGADVVTANTFMSGIGAMTRAGAGDRWSEGVDVALRAAREAIEGVADKPVAIAGSIGASAFCQVHVDDLPAGRARARLDEDYRRLVDRLLAGGADVIALEMTTEPRYGVPAVEAALETGLPVWLGISMNDHNFDDPDLPSLGEAELALRELARPELDSVNVMHTHIDDVPAALAMVRGVWSGHLGVYPHYGIWEEPHWRILDLPPDEFRARAETWIAAGASLVGGCCGTRPAHVAALRALVDERGSARDAG
jgi:S-methylmethionine-dependent homocysteine/selenocysteine methylase